MNKSPRVLCFTTSYNRPYFLYNTIQNILNQTYGNIQYNIGICVDSLNDVVDYKKLLKTFVRDKRLKLYFHPTLDQHSNYLYPIKKSNYDDFDLFVKIDDDDIYHKDYIEKSVNNIQKYNADIISYKITTQINAHKIQSGIFDTSGPDTWKNDEIESIKFGMPFTYVFNKKALKIILDASTHTIYNIHPFEDPGWRTLWRKNKLKSKVIRSNIAVYNIHGKNISCAHHLLKTERNGIDNTDVLFMKFKHTHWDSYIFIEKKSMRCQHMQNLDWGNAKINNDIISITWDNWGKENFQKHTDKSDTYYRLI